MWDFLLSLGVTIGMAWLGKMLLDAKELGWGRLILAAVIGIGIGDATAVLLTATDFNNVENLDYGQIQLVSFPFRVIATMGAVVVLELFFRRDKRDPLGQSASSGKSPVKLGRRFGPAVLRRAAQVSRILARHGFAPLVGWGSGRGAKLDTFDLAKRARSAFEEAGGVFIKLGQLLATRPDLLPPAALAELAKLQSAVAPVEPDAIRAQIEGQLGKPIDEVFESFDWNPLGSASIGQAHSAVLLGGAPVVVKVRRPGLERVIERDLVILGWLAGQAEDRFAAARKLGIRSIAREFAEALVIELDFEIEAQRIAEIAEAVSDEPLVCVPKVYAELSRPGLIVMERLTGTPLSNLPTGQSVLRAEELADALCSSQVKSMLDGRRFHGDPHAGNVLLLADGKLGLIDLGVSSKLDSFERAAVFQLLLALRQEQPALLLQSLVTIGAVDQGEHDLPEIERELARFLTSYLGPSVHPAQAFTDLLRLTLRLGLKLPPSTNAMFRALSTLMGTLELLRPGYPVIDKVAELGGDEFRRRLMPKSVGEFVKQEWSELGPILVRVPRHFDRLAGMIEHGRLTARVRIFAEHDDRRFLERLVNRFVMTLLSIGVGAVSVILLGVEGGVVFPLFSVGLYEVLGWIGLFIAMTLMFRVLLSVLRSEAPAGRT